MRRFMLAFLILLIPSVPHAQQAFYSHDNYTQYELLEPSSGRFAITYYVTERRPGSIYLLNQTRSGSAGSDISVFDPQTGRPLKFDYMTGAELSASGMTGRFDPKEHYIRAHLPRTVPEAGEGRVKILKTYQDEKSYYMDGEDIVFRRSLGIARNSIVLPKGYRLMSSNVASQMFTRPDGRLKISFEHAHGYAADVTIRARKGNLEPAPPATERAFDFSKALYDFGAPETGVIKVTRELWIPSPGPRALLPRSTGLSDPTVFDVDTGRILKTTQTPDGVRATLETPLPDTDQTARLRLTGTLREGLAVEGTQLSWSQRLEEPRVTLLLPDGWDVASVSLPATVTAQPDGRVSIQIYNGQSTPLPVTIRAVKR